MGFANIYAVIQRFDHRESQLRLLGRIFEQLAACQPEWQPEFLEAPSDRDYLVKMHVVHDGIVLAASLLLRGGEPAALWITRLKYWSTVYVWTWHLIANVKPELYKRVVYRFYLLSAGSVNVVIVANIIIWSCQEISIWARFGCSKYLIDEEVEHLSKHI